VHKILDKMRFNIDKLFSDNITQFYPKDYKLLNNKKDGYQFNILLYIRYSEKTVLRINSVCTDLNKSLSNIHNAYNNYNTKKKYGSLLSITIVKILVCKYNNFNADRELCKELSRFKLEKRNCKEFNVNHLNEIFQIITQFYNNNRGDRYINCFDNLDFMKAHQLKRINGYLDKQYQKIWKHYIEDIPEEEEECQNESENENEFDEEYENEEIDNQLEDTNDNESENELSSMITALRDKIESQAETIDDLEKTVSVKDNINKKRKRQIDSLNHELSEKDSRINYLQKVESERIDELLERNRSINELNKRNADNCSKRRRVEIENETLKNKISQKDKEWRHFHNSKVDELNKTNENKKRELNLVKNENISLENFSEFSLKVILYTCPMTFYGFYNICLDTASYLF